MSAFRSFFSDAYAANSTIKAAQLQSLKVELQKNVDKMVSIFHHPAIFSFDSAGPLNFRCVPEGNAEEGVIYYCDSFLKKTIDVYGMVEAVRLNNLILAHEYAHFLLYYDEKKLLEKMPKGIEAVVPFDPNFVIAFIANIPHENIDALAAKLLRHLSLPLPEDMNHFDLSRIVSLDFLPMSVQPYFKKMQSMRIPNVLAAYAEGWSGWRNYRQIYTPCQNLGTDEDSTFSFLRSTLVDSSKIGDRACGLFSDEIIAAEIKKEFTILFQ